MDRLTARTPDKGLAYLAKVKPNEQEVESKYPDTLKCIMESWERLATYEDTGLMPDEILFLKKELEQVKKERDAAVECINQIENYLRALESATDYIKPGTGVWHTVGKALHDVQKWRRKEG